jgi:hypothetical protein
MPASVAPLLLPEPEPLLPVPELEPLLPLDVPEPPLEVLPLVPPDEEPDVPPLDVLELLPEDVPELDPPDEPELLPDAVPLDAPSGPVPDVDEHPAQPTLTNAQQTRQPVFVTPRMMNASWVSGRGGYVRIAPGKCCASRNAL